MKVRVMKQCYRHSKQGRSGIAALEFLFAAPAFFILVFFVVEIALIWNDRHMMRLAAYRAARSVVKSRADIPSNGGLCWTVPQTGTPETPENKKIHAAAKRASAKVMSTVTPSVTQLMTMLGVGGTATGTPAGFSFESAIEQSITSEFGSTVDTIANNPYVHALTRMMKGLPAAWAFTSLKCQDVVYPATANTKETRGVEVSLTYHRSAKMPYIGTIMWSLRKLQQISPSWSTYDGNTGPIIFDPLNYGLRVNNHYVTQELSQMKQALEAEVHAKATELRSQVLESLQLSPESGLGSTIPQIFSSAAGSSFEAVTQSINTGIAQQIVNWVGDKAIEMVLMMPDELKTIPINVSVRIPNFNQSYVNHGQPWNNDVLFLGSLTDGSKIAKMAQKLSTLMDQGNPPNDNQGLPYVQ